MITAFPQWDFIHFSMQEARNIKLMQYRRQFMTSEQHLSCNAQLVQSLNGNNIPNRLDAHQRMGSLNATHTIHFNFYAMLSQAALRFASTFN